MEQIFPLRSWWGPKTELKEWAMNQSLPGDLKHCKWMINNYWMCMYATVGFLFLMCVVVWHHTKENELIWIDLSLLNLKKKHTTCTILFFTICDATKCQQSEPWICRQCIFHNCVAEIWDRVALAHDWDPQQEIPGWQNHCARILYFFCVCHPLCCQSLSSCSSRSALVSFLSLCKHTWAYRPTQTHTHLFSTNCLSNSEELSRPLLCWYFCLTWRVVWWQVTSWGKRRVRRVCRCACVRACEVEDWLTVK